MAEARARKGISRPNISRENLPPETPARISPARIFIRIVLVLGEKGEGWRSFSRLVDARCDAAREEERPPSRLFWKRHEGGWSKERGGAQGRAKGGAPHYKRDGRVWFVVVCCLSRVVGWLVVEVLFLRSRILASCLLFLPVFLSSAFWSLREPWIP